MYKAAFAIAAAAGCAACVTGESIRFQAKPQQEALVRDGQPALDSRKKHSLIIVKPAKREFPLGARPVFVVGINNLGNVPQQFRVADIEVVQNVGPNTQAMKVVTYEELVTEERNRQIFAAVVTGLAAAGNAYSASQQGYYNSTSTVTGPRGTYQVSTTGYSPAAASIAQANATAQNDAMISATVERGQRNMAALESAVIKDNTLLSGEWYGGQLHLAPPSADAVGPKTYTISILVGADRHDVDVTQGAQR